MEQPERAPRVPVDFADDVAQEEVEDEQQLHEYLEEKPEARGEALVPQEEEEGDEVVRVRHQHHKRPHILETRLLSRQSDEVVDLPVANVTRVPPMRIPCVLLE